MAGGFIFEKTIDSAFQGGTDKSLIIDPNYAYQVPFTFGTGWSDIKIGMFVSYVMTGVGVDAQGNAVNGNSGVPHGSIFSAGGTSTDTFNYVGITRSSATNSLPLSPDNSGYLGLQADRLHVYDTAVDGYNKLIHSDESSDSEGDARFIATNSTTTLEAKEFRDTNGNFNVVAGNAATFEAADSSPERTSGFCDYWGMRFQVIDKGLATQRIRFTASINGDASTVNDQSFVNTISDPSLAALKLLMNGVGEFSYKIGSQNMHSSSTFSLGFDWNDGSSAYELPDSLFFYNAFQDLRPRIHTWAVKKIS